MDRGWSRTGSDGVEYAHLLCASDLSRRKTVSVAIQATDAAFAAYRASKFENITRPRGWKMQDLGSLEYDIAYVLQHKIGWPAKKREMDDMRAAITAEQIAKHLRLCGWQMTRAPYQLGPGFPMPRPNHCEETLSIKEVDARGPAKPQG